MVDNIYLRQKNLDLDIPDSVTVVGCGGVGSWVALLFALLGTKKIILVDDDIVEIHNLNRTPFTLVDVGCKKVEAVANLIYERREDCEVIVYDKRIDRLKKEELSEIESTDLIIDCRDNFSRMPVKGNIVLLRYDGSKIFIEVNPDYDKYWGDSHGYRTVPSFVAPPVFLSIIPIILSCLNKDKLNKSFTIRLDLTDLLNKLL